MSRILIIEDETPMCTALKDVLEAEGYRVLTAADGERGLRLALAEQPDLILLDIMMPQLDGFEVCAELRRLDVTTPILMLTAKGQVEDRVTGLDAGADDYLVKPFSTEELLARVRALRRRLERQGRAPTKLKLGDVEIDLARQTAVRVKTAQSPAAADVSPRASQPNQRRLPSAVTMLKHGAGRKEIHLTAKEFAMLRLMAETPGEPVTRERFLDVVWGYAAFPTTRTVDNHIASLRAKLEPDPDEPRWIRTVHGVGYKLEVGE